jgi:hypothetical protein
MHVSAMGFGLHGIKHDKYLASAGEMQNKKWWSENENCRKKRQL